MEGEEEEEAGQKEINDKAVSFAVSGLPCYREKKERERVCSWKEPGRKRNTEALPGCRSSATLDWCERV